MEFFDICDERGLPTGEVVERSVAHSKGILHRTAHVWIIKKLETDAMVLLFTNLLDNAIEACLRLDTERIIRCSILAENGLYLSVKNTSPPVTIRDGSIPTSKHPPEEHGYGLMSVQRVLKERNAEYSYDYLDGWFRFAAEIPE